MALNTAGLSTDIDDVTLDDDAPKPVIEQAEVPVIPSLDDDEPSGNEDDDKADNPDKDKQDPSKQQQQQEEQGGEGSTTKTPEQIQQEEELARQKQQEAIDQQKQEAQAEWLKSLGVSSMEELQQKLNPTPELTEEQKAQQQQIYDLDLAKYAVENKVMTNDELLQLQNFKRTDPQELVYAQFSKEFKELHKDRVGEDGKPDVVTEDEVRDSFNQLYHIDSESDYLKKQGQKTIEVKAEMLRSSLQNKYNDIKEVFDAEQEERKLYPAFGTFFKDAIQSSIPAKLEFGEGEEAVSFDLKDLDKAAIQKSIESKFGAKEFQDFKKGKGSDEQRARIREEVEKEIFYNNRKDIVKLARTVGFSAGTEKAASHDRAPFQEQGKSKISQKGSVNEITEEDDARLAKRFKS